MLDVYYIEDDRDIGAGVKQYLEGRGFSVSVYVTIAHARTALLQKQPAIALVDWNMPDGSGAELCSWIRREWSALSVILLTVKSDSSEIIQGFACGADDYIVKPFELGILHSRMLALLRRAGVPADIRALCCDDIVMDDVRKMVFRQGQEVALSQLEYQLLYLLISNKGRTLTRERLLEQVWDYSGAYVNDNTLTVAIKRLREKLGMPACIKTIRSFGYRMEETV